MWNYSSKRDPDDRFLNAFEKCAVELLNINAGALDCAEELEFGLITKAYMASKNDVWYETSCKEIVGKYMSHWLSQRYQ